MRAYSLTRYCRRFLQVPLGMHRGRWEAVDAGERVFCGVYVGKDDKRGCAQIILV